MSENNSVEVWGLENCPLCLEEADRIQALGFCVTHRDFDTELKDMNIIERSEIMAAYEWGGQFLPIVCYQGNAMVYGEFMKVIQ